MIPTMDLRWAYRQGRLPVKGELVESNPLELQQRFIDREGNDAWVAVPVIKEY